MRKKWTYEDYRRGRNVRKSNVRKSKRHSVEQESSLECRREEE